MKVLSIAVIVLIGCAFAQEPKCTTEEELKSLFSHPDPSKYYVCYKKNEPYVLPCPDGRGFAKNDNVMGCLPWADWRGEFCSSWIPPTIDCTGDPAQRVAHQDPSKYWVCDEGKPKEMSCDEGEGWVESSGKQGCEPWDKFEC